jgi:hypothetical protein
MIKLKWLVCGISLVLFCISDIARAADAPSKAGKSKTADVKTKKRAPTAVWIDDETFAKIKVGDSTGDEVKKLLGTPWRITNYGETYCGCPHKDMQEVWEYRGRDSSGTYKYHIELDDEGVVHTARKIPDSARSPQRQKKLATRPLTAER